jgi:hypothetical protein
MMRDMRLVKEIFGSLLQLRAELPRLEDKEIIYYTDFNLIYPFIHRQTEARYRFTDTLGTCLFHLNNSLRKPANIHVCISLPTTIEFLIFLQRHHDLFQEHLRNEGVSTYVYQRLIDLENGRINVRDIEAEKVKHYLLLAESVTSYGDRISRFVRSISEQKIDHLTDYYSANDINGLLARNDNLLRAIDQTMRIERESADDRNSLSKEVSYKVDVHNIFLPSLNSLNSKKEINFVCSGRFYKWTPDPFLKTFQRTPLFLITLLGNLYENGEPMSGRIQTLSRWLDEQIRHGKYLLEYADSHLNVPLEVENEIEVFLYRNYTTYVDMAKRLSSSRPDQESPVNQGMPSYDDYLAMMDGRKRTVERSMQAIHAMIDDRRDDQYRDFIDDGRIRRALSTLKLG